jgi:hypothetical protein
MANPSGVNALQLDGIAPSIRCIAALGGVLSSRVWLGIIQPEDPSPLLDGLVIVGWRKSGVSSAMIDLHLGVVAAVARIHVFNHLQPSALSSTVKIYHDSSDVGITYPGPDLRSAVDLALGTRTVPSVGSTGLAVETSGRDPRVNYARGEHFRVCCRHHVLGRTPPGQHASNQSPPKKTYRHHGA